MNHIKNIIFFIGITFFASCEKVFMEPNPQTDNLSIFDEYATLVKEKYAMLDFKGVQIDFLRDSIRATISDDLTQAQLFEKLTIITHRLRDAHSNLFEVGQDLLDTTHLTATFDLLAGYPSGIDITILANNYINTAINPAITFLWKEDSSDIKAIYGTLPQDTDIGYLWIPSWEMDMTDDEIETIFTAIKGKKGLIFDMRLNGGGDPALATQFAAYFTETPIYTGFERFKTGPKSTDFSDSPVTLQPASSSNKFLNPVAVLTDRNVYSASTTFLYSTAPLSQFMTIGQRTGGGSGSVADGYLANGWYWSLSTSEFIDHLDRHLDDGIEPDIAVALDLNDTTKDEVIERAILELQ